MSVHHVGAEGNAPLGWRLYLLESWANDEQRRLDAGIPAGVVFRPKWELALDIIDQIRGCGLADRVVLADAGYGESAEFRQELEHRRLRYIVGVAPQVGVRLEPPRLTLLKALRTGRPPSTLHYGDQRPLSAKAVAQQAAGWKTIGCREGSRGRLKSRFRAGRVQPSHGFHEGKPPLTEVWLLVEWPESEPESTCGAASHEYLRHGS